MAEEMAEMQAALERCKSIVTGILVSAGEAGEASSVTTANTFLTEPVDERRGTRPVSALSFRNEFGADLAIVSDTALKQVVFNVLDSAHEASPHGVEFAASRDE